jgi:hypothetical protein
VSEIKPYYASDATLFPNRLTTRVPTFPIDSIAMPIQRIVRHRMQEDAHEQPYTGFLCESEDLETHWISSTHPEFDVNADYVRNYLEHIQVQSLDELNAANAPVRDAVSRSDLNSNASLASTPAHHPSELDAERPPIRPRPRLTQPPRAPRANRTRGAPDLRDQEPTESLPSPPIRPTRRNPPRTGRVQFGFARITPHLRHSDRRDVAVRQHSDERRVEPAPQLRQRPHALGPGFSVHVSIRVPRGNSGLGGRM